MLLKCNGRPDANMENILRYCRDNIKLYLRVSSRLQLKAMCMLRVFLVQRFFETLQYCDGGTKIQPSHTYIHTYTHIHTALMSQQTWREKSVKHH